MLWVKLYHHWKKSFKRANFYKTCVLFLEEEEKADCFAIIVLQISQLTENVFTTFLFGCIEVSLQRNVV